MTTRLALPFSLIAVAALLWMGSACDEAADDTAMGDGNHPPAGMSTVEDETQTPPPEQTPDDVMTTAPASEETPDVVPPPAAGSARIGEPAPNFQLPDATGTLHTLSDHLGSIIVLEWTNYDCPVVGRHYRSNNMQSLKSRHMEEDVVWFSVCSSAPGQQGHFTGETLLQRIAGNGANPATYLVDEAGVVGHAYSATATPHMYVIDTVGMLRYQGAIDNDNRGRLPADEVVNYVDAAIAAIRAGETVETTSTRSYGCSVKYEN